MSTTVRVYVNSRGIDAPSGGSAIDAVRLFDPAVAVQVTAGERIISDSRGLPVPADAPLYGGAIFRIVSNRLSPRAGDDE